MLRPQSLLRVVLIPFAFTACADTREVTGPLTSAPRLEANVAPAAGAATRTYDVTITNLTTGQPFSPGVLATHTKQAAFFHVGDPASEGLRLIAENGDETTAVAELTGRAGVFQVVDVNAPTGRVGGSLPTSRTFRIEAAANANRISLAVMLICTNDGFTGLDGVALPGGFKPLTYYTAGYDAGTEANDELSTSIVDACFAIGPTTRPPDGNARTPTIGVIEHHPGIQGIGDLDPTLHGWRDPVARITIRRVQ